jgi:hypothetical protein
MPAQTTDAPTLGAQLERARLQHRAQRIERVLRVLEARRTEGIRSGERPSALEQAIAGFGDELGTVRARLRRLG